MSMPRLALRLLVALALATAATRAARADWPSGPSQAVTLLGQDTAIEAVAVSDGTGGVIAVWGDARSGTRQDPYAQRVGADGTTLWTNDGISLIPTITTGVADISACPDAAGGVFVVWRDVRGGNTDIYAQRVNAAGTRLWGNGGLPVCTASGDQYSPRAVSDGAGGVIVTWSDGRPATHSDIYAQRLNASGAPQWTAGGVAVCNAANNQSQPRLVSDGAGGAIVAWVDSRNTATTLADLYTQRLTASGAALWLANGYPICTATGNQSAPELVSDGNGGAIYAWADSRAAGNDDIYVTRMLAGGSYVWTTNGVLVCGAASDQRVPVLVEDGAAGAIVAWHDFRAGDFDIYAQRVVPSGAPTWAANGLAICTATGSQTSPTIASDGAGGAIVAWDDSRAGVGSDLYARRISAAGTPLWNSNGNLLVTETSNQYGFASIADGAGGAIAMFVDDRGPGSWRQVRAQHVERYGQLGDPAAHITSVRDVPNDQGGRVKVSWDASPLDADPTFGVFDYRVWRSAPTTAAGAKALLARGTTRDPEDAATHKRWLVLPLNGQDVAWELVATQGAALLGSYSVVVETTGDSAAAGNPRTHFMVEARTSTSLSANRWYSAPDSGYSVDNLAPATPAPFTAQFLGAQTVLDWNANLEADLAGYRLYRGASVAFVPSEANRIAAPVDTDWLDAAGAPYVYKLTAVDVHGNESPAATVIPAGTTGVDDAPLAFALAAPSPNPATRATTLRFALPSAGAASLVVYDANGRAVRTLAHGAHAAGAHTATWDLRDDTGARVAPGMYFARIVAGAHETTRKLLVTK